MSVYVGIDVHRKRSQIAVVDDNGSVRVNRNVSNGVKSVLSVIGDLPIGAPVAFEAAYGWGRLVELLEDYGFEPHLAHPLRCKAIASACLKNDKADAATLAQLLRADLLPEAWIAPLDVRQQRALLRHRCQLVRLRTLLRHRIHAVLADLGRDRPGGYFTAPGRIWLDSLGLPDASRRVADDLLDLIDALKAPIDALDRQLLSHARGDPRVTAPTQLPGAGTLTALVIVAEVGDITRFPSARKLAAWAGLTPTVRGSDLTVRHGHLSKQGSDWLRWILCEAAQTAKRSPESAAYQQIARCGGKKIATPRLPAGSSPAPTTSCAPSRPGPTIRPRPARSSRGSGRSNWTPPTRRSHRNTARKNHKENVPAPTEKPQAGVVHALDRPALMGVARMHAISLPPRPPRPILTATATGSPRQLSDQVTSAQAPTSLGVSS